MLTTDDYAQQLADALASIEKLRHVGDPRDRLAGGTIETGRVQGLAALFIASATNDAARTLGRSVDDFTSASDASAARLTRWTKIMALATIWLALTAVIQIALLIARWSQ